MRAALLSLALLPLLACAQNWCPPGATWTYGMQADWGEGYYQLTYVSDTLLGGEIGQTIHSQQHFHHYDVDSVIVGASEYYVTTRSDADLVWLWRANAMTWDTLYWFGAVPGDHWLPPNIVGLCPGFERIEVVDTGTVILAGLPLRYLDIRQAGESDTLYSRITERLGWAWEMNIWPPCATGPALWAQGLRCYSDEQLAWTDPAWDYGCNSVLAVDQRSVTPPLPFPNPGTTHFTLSLPPGPHTITLFDTTGRRVMEWSAMTGQVMMDTSHLPAGTYLIRAVDQEGRTSQQIWIKA